MGNIWKWAILSGFLFFTGCGGGGSTSAPAPIQPPKYTGETCMSANALLLGGGGNAPIVDAADFDGTNDSMARGANLTGAADSKSGIFSAWFRIDGGDGSVRHLLFAGSGFEGLRVSLGTDNKLIIKALNSGAATILEVKSSAIVASSTWRHVLASWDLSTPAVHLYITDVSDLATTTLTNNTIDYTTNSSVGGLGTAATFNGCLAEFYYAQGAYLDFSVEANRRKFISAAGKPVHLGVDGSVPTGTAPIVYLHLDDGEAVANFATNRGTGGNFTITGTLDTATTSPSD